MVVPSGDTTRPSADADASSNSVAAVLRMILLSRCEYCFFGSFSSLHIYGRAVPVAAVVVVVVVADAVSVVCNNVLWLRNRYYNECWYRRKSNTYTYRIDHT